METCVRGFSFMPESNIELPNLQYVENEQLERTWKNTRRLRLKEQEERIWNEFVKEQDIVTTVCKDDPYQFLHELPETCIQDLLQSELQKMQEEEVVDETKNPAEEPSTGTPPADQIQDHTVRFVIDENADDDCEIFQILEDDNSEPEVDVLNDTLGSPVTVRELYSEEKNPLPISAAFDSEKESGKSSENVASMIESSIYCAKIKDLKMKIDEELLSLVTSLSCQEPSFGSETSTALAVRARSSQFCARFSRVRLYPLHRQADELSRRSVSASHFAKHTHAQLQMSRLVSLHQNLLQALQIFHKSLETCVWLHESMATLRALVACTRRGAELCRTVPELPAHDTETACQKLEAAVDQYDIKVTNFLNSYENEHPSRRNKAKAKPNNKTWVNTNSNNKVSSSNVDGVQRRLSMYSVYSLDGASRGRSSGTSKRYGLMSPKDLPQEKEKKKSNRVCRPLMRAPASTRVGRGGRRARRLRDSDVRTLVETVDMCTPSHISPDTSPHRLSPSNDFSPRCESSPHTPRSIRRNLTPKKSGASISTTPRSLKLRNHSPKAKTQRCPKLGPDVRVALSSIKSEEASSEDVHILPIKLSPIPKKYKFKSDVKRPLSAGPENNVKNKDGKVILPKVIDKKYSIQERTNNLKNDDCKEMNKEHSDTDLTKGDAVLRVLEESVSTPKSGSSTQRVKKTKKVKETGANKLTPRSEGKIEGDKISCLPDRHENQQKSGRMSKVLKLLCGGEDIGKQGFKNDRVSGAKNAQLFCMSGDSSPPLQPSTPHLLRILEETIQKKAHKPHYHTKASEVDRFRLVFNIPEQTSDRMFQYRTKYVQHMLSSTMYANSAIGKPWEMISSVSEDIINELLLQCVKEMQLDEIVQEMYKIETC